MTAFLNVDSSLTGRRWVGPDPAQDRQAEAMVQQTRRPHPEQVVARRDEAAANEQATGDHDACTCLHARRAAHRTPSAR